MSDAAITIREIGYLEEALDIVAQITGFQRVLVGDAEYLLPSDQAHPEYGICEQRITRARKRLGAMQ